jgi:hypothetical protein
VLSEAKAREGGEGEARDDAMGHQRKATRGAQGRWSPRAGKPSQKPRRRTARHSDHIAAKTNARTPTPPFPCHPSASVASSGTFLKRPGYSGRARLRDAPARSRQWMLLRRPDNSFRQVSLSVGTMLIDTYIQECNRLRQKDGLDLRVDTERFTSIFTGRVTVQN